MTTEVWKDVPGYEGLYQVSNTGKVKRVKSGHGAKPGRILRVQNVKGYARVYLYRNRKGRNWCIHHLVMLAFIGECPEGMNRNHKDGNPMNNHADNLEYTTPKENSQHAIQVLGWIPNGEGAAASKLTWEQVEEIRRRHEEGESYTQIAEDYPVTWSNIGIIVRGESWQTHS